MHSHKILVLTRKDIFHPRAGGAEVVLQEYMKGLINRGYTVTQLAPRFPGSTPTATIDGVHIIRKFSLYTIYFNARRWYLFCMEKDRDAIIDHAGGIPLLSPLYARNKRIIFFIHHLGEQEWRDEFARWHLGRLGSIAQKIYTYGVLFLYKKKPTITVSQGTASALRSHGFTAVHVLYNATTIPLIQEHTIAKKKNTLTIIGRIIPNKQMDHAVTVLHHLQKQGYDYTLSIVWPIQDQNAYTKILRVIEQYALQWSVHFLGKLDTQEIIALLDTTQYLLITSDKEWFGMTAIEAHKRAVPVIGYAIPWVDEVIRPGINGYLITKNDPHAMALSIIDHANDYAALVASTIATAKAYPTRETNVQSLINLI